MTKKQQPKIKHLKSAPNFQARMAIAKKGIPDKGILGKLTIQEQQLKQAYVFTIAALAFESAYRAGRAHLDPDSIMDDSAKQDMQDKFNNYMKPQVNG